MSHQPSILMELLISLLSLDSTCLIIVHFLKCMTIIATPINESVKVQCTSNNYVEYRGDMEREGRELLCWRSLEGQLSPQKVIWQGNFTMKGWKCSKSGVTCSFPFFTLLYYYGKVGWAICIFTQQD